MIVIQQGGEWLWQKVEKYPQKFKEDAMQYRLDHPELPLRKAAENLGVSESASEKLDESSKGT